MIKILILTSLSSWWHVVDKDGVVIGGNSGKVLACQVPPGGQAFQGDHPSQVSKLLGQCEDDLGVCRWKWDGSTFTTRDSTEMKPDRDIKLKPYKLRALHVLSRVKEFNRLDPTLCPVTDVNAVQTMFTEIKALDGVSNVTVLENLIKDLEEWETKLPK